ncbi:phycobiliprotein lyase [Stenomitos frigidus]|uniref:Chromophore lyase CpcS/CpeS n=1 Tax=Stenomitos frigidus ULC18 TaxID=2107698 RepID=A0A2T1ESB5_9CYAN|nr:phycobiliprotein lyase [Stenomitos frigidus]PSB35650.1 phycobiliprotein lyase [Stenomitos frigidus ULC18]
MDIVEFFQRSSGKWFSQRTSHALAFEQAKGGQSELQIELLPQTDPAVIKLCEQYKLDPTLALCGLRVNWDGTTEGEKAKQVGNTVLVPIADPDSPNEGTLLRTLGPGEKVLLAGRYSVGSDETLTLTAESETMYSEERLWFANPNLRFRTSVLKQSGGFSTASFCSEIRKGVTSPPPATTQSIADKKA